MPVNNQTSNKAVVIGLCGVDEVITLAAPLEPGLKQPSLREHRDYGWFAMNVSSHLRDSENVSTTVLTVVGQDMDGQAILEHLRRHGVTVHAERRRNLPTPHSHVLAYQNGSDSNPIPFQKTAAGTWLVEQFEKRILDGAGALTMGHIPADWDGSITENLISVAANGGTPVTWAPGRTQLKLGLTWWAPILSKVRILTLNRDEAAEFCGLDPETTTARDAANALSPYLGPDSVYVVTDGPQHASAWVSDARGGKTRWCIPPITVSHVVDTTGAGDAFHSGLIIGKLFNNLPVQQCFELARQRAGQVVRQVGAGLWNGRPNLELAREPEPIVMECMTATTLLRQGSDRGSLGPL